MISDTDRYLFGEGNHTNIYRFLGSHHTEVDDVEGLSFAVWAPNVLKVSVVGDFNGWDGNQHGMKALPSGGLWEIFIPLLPQGTLYKFEIYNSQGNLLPLKHDPYAMYCEQPPGNACITATSHRHHNTAIA